MRETLRCDDDCGCPDDDHNAPEIGGDCTVCGYECEGYIPGYQLDNWPPTDSSDDRTGAR